MDSSLYNQTGKKVGTVTLPESVFAVPWNGDLLHQVSSAMQANARMPVAHAKDRSEVSGGGKKPWRQKGTGRARHGSIRSPIWVGGGVTHGPTNEKSYAKKINKKMRAKALATALSQKLRDDEILFVDALSLAETRTKEAAAILHALSQVKGFEELTSRKTLLVLPAADQLVMRSFRNIPALSVVLAKDLNPVMLLNHRAVIFVSPDAVMKLWTEAKYKAAK